MIFVSSRYRSSLNGEHGDIGRSNNAFGDASGEEPTQSRAPVRSHHDDVDVVFRGVLRDEFVRCSLHERSGYGDVPSVPFPDERVQGVSPNRFVSSPGVASRSGADDFGTALRLVDDVQRVDGASYVRAKPKPCSMAASTASVPSVGSKTSSYIR